jgi:hypothetical protein
LFGAALAHELETSAIAQIMQISDGMLIVRAPTLREASGGWGSHESTSAPGARVSSHQR